ncbi:TPM domain-containing protein [Aureimonas pseudogalii]|uniref:TPM domain-containing protein n=1 Tax=Aureimonas pseudogalii TaxID=1744844 RepID=A0A7W6H425_9HYPH|nr:TPM domain-containing protein [Aureimonas pseudogalii]MBB3997518.1 uncharacterized protein [Aureimonas pseudogalii]
MSEALGNGALRQGTAAESVRRRFAGLAAALALAVAAMVAALPAGAQAPAFPALTGRVVDAAGLLDATTRAALEAKLAAHEQLSSDQLVVATVPDLGGLEIADYGTRLGRAWRIGRTGEDNGAILLVSKGDRRVRIEVGYGLEGTLTDALSRVVIETDILPRFRTGDVSGGIVAGTDAILEIIEGDAAAVEARARRNAGWQEAGESDVAGRLVVVFILLVAVGPMILALLGRLTGRRPGPARRRRSPFGGGFGPGFGGGFGSGMGGGFGGSSGSGGGGFSGGGGSFGGGGASGSW